MNNLRFIQCTEICNVGLLEIFLYQLKNVQIDIFKAHTVIVPSVAMGSWLKDKITLELSICCNINFLTLNQFLQQLFLAKHKNVNFASSSEITFAIYEYLCLNSLIDNMEVKEFLGKDIYKAYQLAKQLQIIFQEYIYLRTDELLNIELSSKIPLWQKKVWQHIVSVNKLTFLDIYKYFIDVAVIDNLDENIFIFAINDIYPAQLHIITKIAAQTNVFWYSLAVSNKYYGDLLSSSTKIRLQQKILREPNLSISDLYLTEGNALVANLAQRSREFNELIISQGIEIDTFESNISYKSLLSLIQYDIKNIYNRIDCKYHLTSHESYYKLPLKLDYDKSVNINICYNKMREIEVLFNEIAGLINNNQFNLNDILVVSPDINQYSEHIKAVFDNEYLKTKNGKTLKLSYNLVGIKLTNELKVLQVIKLIFNVPFNITVNYFIDLINQEEVMQALQFTIGDIQLICSWLKDNNIYSGFTDENYQFEIHTFRRFLLNLVLGLCIPTKVALDNETLPIIPINNKHYTFYDNVENSHAAICNNLISLIDFLFDLRIILYQNDYNFNSCTVDQVIAKLNIIQTRFIKSSYIELIVDNIVCRLKSIAIQINLAIINDIFNEVEKQFTKTIWLSNKLNFTSLQVMRNIPYKVIFILGMSFNEFPRQYNPNKLSIIAKEWSITDRNYNLEDKQLFLDLVLATQEKLYISYIGRNQNSNNQIRPSTTLNLFLEVIKKSLIEGEAQIEKMVKLNALHPFYYTNQLEYSVFWSNVRQNVKNNKTNLRWNWQKSKLIEDMPQTVTIKKLINTFLYTNTNLRQKLNLIQYTLDTNFIDHESLDLISRSRQIQIFNALDKINSISYTQEELHTYLLNKGIISYGSIGQYQLSSLERLYQKYKYLQGKSQVKIHYKNDHLQIEDNLTVNLSNNLIVMEDFANIQENNLDQIKISLKLQVKTVIYYLLTQFASFTDSKNNIIKIKNICLVIINLAAEHKIYQIRVKENVDIESLWQQIIKFYHQSLSTPTLIHRKAIEKYIETTDIIKSEKICLDEYNNKDLTTIKSDFTFCNTVEIYQAISDNIIIIGEIFNKFEIEEKL